MYKEYTAEEYTEACRLLLEMRDNCLKTYGENEYSDPKKEEKAKALNIALDAIDRIDWFKSDTKQTDERKAVIKEIEDKFREYGVHDGNMWDILEEVLNEKESE